MSAAETIAPAIVTPALVGADKHHLERMLCVIRHLPVTAESDPISALVNYRQLKQAASEATHEPLPYVSASRQGVRVHPPHAALACRSGPKGCLLFIGSISTRRRI